MKLLISSLFLLSLVITSCSKSKIDVKGLVKSSGAKGDPAQVSSVAITNNQLIVNGSNLSGVTQVRVTGPSAFDQTFSVESASENSLVVNGLSAISFAVGQVFNLIITNAHGAATFPVTFTLSDNSVTTIKILDSAVTTSKISDGAVTKDKLDTASVAAGEILQFDGTNWQYVNIGNSGLNYQGNWDANANDLALTDGCGTDGDYYIVSVADGAGGTVIDGIDIWGSGDWIICSASTWRKIVNSSTITSVFGKTGAVTADMSDLTDALITTPADGQILVYDNADSRWENFSSLLLSPATGNATFSNDVEVTGALTVGGTNVCLSDGTNCLPAGTPSTVANGGGNVVVNASSGTDDIDLQTGGTTRLKVDNTGNIGLGVGTPSTALHVKKDEDDLITIDRTDNASVSNKFKIGSKDNGSKDILTFGSDTTADSLVIDEDGNVGIGTTAPTAALDVSGTAKISGVLNVNGINMTGGALNYNSSGNFVPISVSNSGGYAHIRANGFEVGGDSTSTNEGYIKTTDNSRAIRLKPTGISFTSEGHGTEAVRITSSGNVGIGTTTPGEKLDIDGSINLIETSNTDSSKGKIKIDGFDFLYQFSYGDNGTVTPNGKNTFLGYRAGNQMMGATATTANHSSYNIGIGPFTLFANTLGQSNIAMGFDALRQSTEGDNNIGLGYSSLRSLTTANNNVAIGRFSMNKVTEGTGNVGIGSSAGGKITTGASNVSIGASAGVGNVDGDHNISIGSSSYNQGVSGIDNISIGRYAGYGASGESYSKSISIGQGAGYSQGNSAGENVFLGTNAGGAVTGSGNVMLGFQAGRHETGSDKLYIDNSDTSSPLIGGDFSSDEIYLNGTVWAQELCDETGANCTDLSAGISGTDNSAAAAVTLNSDTDNSGDGGFNFQTNSLTTTSISADGSLNVSASQSPTSTVTLNNNTNSTFVTMDRTSHADVSNTFIMSVGDNGVGTPKDYVSIGPSGTPDAFIITEDGRIGLGTNNPSYDLDLTTSGSIRTGEIRLSQDSGSSTIKIVGESFGTRKLTFHAGEYIFGRYTSPVLSISSNENVGIGAITPTAILDIESTRTGSGTIAGATTTITGTGSSFLNEVSVGDFLEVSGVKRRIASIINDTSLTLDNAFPTDPGGVAYTLEKKVNLGDGNVGIGTTTPERKLEVVDKYDKQLRLSKVAGTTYTDLYTNNGGQLILNTTGDKIFLEQLEVADEGTTVVRVKHKYSVGHLKQQLIIEGAEDQGGHDYGMDSGDVYIVGGKNGDSAATGDVILGHDSTDPRGFVAIGKSGPDAILDIETGRNGSGTITGSTTAITGVGSEFTNELAIGDIITNGGENRRVVAIADATNLTIDTAFSVDPGGSAFIIEKKVVLGDGNVGIGTTAPTANLEIVDNDASTSMIIKNSSSTLARIPSIKVENYNGGLGGYPSIDLTNARGSEASPAATQAADPTGLFQFWGSDGTTTRRVSSIGSYAESTTTGTNAAGFLQFNTTSTNTVTPSEKLRITADGNIGIGTTAPGASLEVNRAYVSGEEVVNFGQGVNSRDFRMVYNSSADFIDWHFGNRFQISRKGGSDTSIETTGGLDMKVEDLHVSGVSNASKGIIHLNSLSGNSAVLSAKNSNVSTLEIGNYDGSGYTYDQTTIFKKGNVIVENGNVGIGTTTPSHKLVVATGSICVASDTDCDAQTDTVGTIFADTTTISAADYAEYFLREGELRPGDIVGLNSETGLARYYQSGDVILGVVSTKPGVLGNNKMKDQEVSPIALMGQVPFNAHQVVIEKRVIKTLDGIILGTLLSDGNMYLNISSKDSQQDRKIASLEKENKMLKDYLCSKDANAPFCKKD